MRTVGSTRAPPLSSLALTRVAFQSSSTTAHPQTRAMTPRDSFLSHGTYVLLSARGGTALDLVSDVHHTPWRMTRHLLHYGSNQQVRIFLTKTCAGQGILTPSSGNLVHRLRILLTLSASTFNFRNDWYCPQQLELFPLFE